MEVTWPSVHSTYGFYTIVFLLIFTSISTRAHLIFHKSVLVGSNVTLTCPIFTAFGPVVWSRISNDTLMSDKMAIRRFKNVSELRVRDAHWMDAGVYQCESADSGLIATTRLTVTCKTTQTRHRVVLTKFSEFKIQQGDDIQLDCNTFDANWRRQTSRGVEQRFYSARRLNICNVQTTDAGVYSCSADDDQQLQQLVRNIRLVVEYAPAVHSPRPHVHQALNYSSHLECVIDALPTASVVWFKDDVAINDTSRYQLSLQTRGRSASTVASTLVVLRTDHGDYGNYTCRAVNALGFSTFTLQLGPSSLPILPMTRGTNLTQETDRTNARTPSFSGFVLGMLPPLCISVYIILHLSFFRSRYAEERTEEEGGDGLDEIVWEQGFKT